MDLFLGFVGMLLIIASVVFSLMIGDYALIIFPVIFALGCINIGLGKIVQILEQIKNNNLK